MTQFDFDIEYKKLDLHYEKRESATMIHKFDIMLETWRIRQSKWENYDFRVNISYSLILEELIYISKICLIHDHSIHESSE